MQTAQIPLLVLGTVLLAGMTVARPEPGMAQNPATRDVPGVDVIVRDWEVRGIAIGAARKFAVLVQRRTGHHHVLEVGDGLPGGAAIADIAEDRVLIHVDGGTATLRLGHGPSRPAFPRAVPRASGRGWTGQRQSR